MSYESNLSVVELLQLLCKEILKLASEPFNELSVICHMTLASWSFMLYLSYSWSFMLRIRSHLKSHYFQSLTPRTKKHSRYYFGNGYIKYSQNVDVSQKLGYIFTTK